MYDQRQLRALLAIVDQGSLNRAAGHLHMTQPTLSRLLAEMERQLDQRLFERTTKGMVATQAGEALVPYARLILHEMESADTALLALRGLRRGVARIGAVATIARSILPPAVAKYLEDAPGLQVTVLERADDQLVAALLKREIDLMIAATLPAVDGITVIRECPYEDAFSVFCSPDHPLLRQPWLVPEALNGQQWVMPAKGATPRQMFDELMVKSGADAAEVVVETSSLDAMVSFVANSRLLGWLPRPLLSQALGAGAIRALDVRDFDLSRRFFLYRRTQGVLPDPVQKLLKYIAPMQR
ncbi:LysR family transcriptional regulator [Sphingobium sp.]|uniref:LysR family transcriptional regulator n=1 Tax=Sphingobium sp. TaxID=1912891 RepID=UPI0028BDC816|nr:LysR family transcriptional regulator [Sphingobium sp.]